MHRSFAVAGAVVACMSLVACASRTTASGVSATPVQAGAHPDMPGMSEHDMASMSTGSHSKAELAFLFPDGNDQGWSKLENGMQHDMSPDVPLARIAPEVRAQLDNQLWLT